MKSIKEIKSKTNPLMALGVFALSLFATASAVYLYSPVLGSNASNIAVQMIEYDINPVISVSLDTNAIEFEVAPTSAGVFSSQSVDATVSVNTPSGYELYFSSIDNSAAMTSPITESVISSDFSGTVTSSTMANNTWGYSLNGTDFSKVPVLASPITIRNIDHFPSASEKTTTISFATKVDTNLPSGTYAKDVIFSTVIHSLPNTTLHEISTMQEMRDDICYNTTTPSVSATQFDWDGSHKGDDSYVPRKKLLDIRDNNYYLVSKLADGSCWMSQNLALDLDSNVALTSDTTDLNSRDSWTPPYSTQTVHDIPWLDDAPRSYHPLASDAYYKGGTVKSGTPTANTDEYLWESAGNYYNWYAMTAGSGTEDTAPYDEAPDSICPKGWILPRYIYPFKTTSGNEYQIDEVQGLFIEYGFYSQYVRAMNRDGNALSLSNKISGNPINLPFSGCYAYEDGSLCDQGEDFGHRVSSSFMPPNFVEGVVVSPDGYQDYLEEIDWENDKIGRNEGTFMRCVAR